MEIIDPWFKTVCDSYKNPPVFHHGKKLPDFPSDQLQINTTGQAGEHTLKEAFQFYQDCINTFSAHGGPVVPESQLLDFGVGWGRIARFFLHELPIEHIHGVDVTPEFVAICRETFNSDNFSVTSPFPPTVHAAGSFTHIVGYSVFSHLSEQACMSWMQEFHRLLKPGGVVAVTTRGRPFFDFCESLKNTEHDGYLRALGQCFDDFDQARARYDAGEFVHSNKDGVTGGGSMSADFYGESFIPQGYAERAYADWFDLLEFQYEPSRQAHPILFFKKR